MAGMHRGRPIDGSTGAAVAEPSTSTAQSPGSAHARFLALGDNEASRLTALGRHRLTPLADMLAQRGWLPPATARAASALARHSRAAMTLRQEREVEVMRALGQPDLPVLVLKGALLGWTIYPDAASRLRSDLDVLVSDAGRQDVELKLGEIGMRPSMPAHGGPPMGQSQWIFADKQGGFALDLHWRISNHPAVREVLSFNELVARAQPLDALASGARGLSRVDALLHACIHYYAHHRNEFRPLQWVLDMDLLWRAMDRDERAMLTTLALEKQIAGLVAAGLILARDSFDTPVEAAEIDKLATAGRRQPATRLLTPPANRFDSWFERIAWEPTLAARWRALRRSLFPPAAYMNLKYPQGSRLGLPGLWLKRLWQGLWRR